jgi:hypothetical protein
MATSSKLLYVFFFSLPQVSYSYVFFFSLPQVSYYVFFFSKCFCCVFVRVHSILTSFPNTHFHWSLVSYLRMLFQLQRRWEDYCEWQVGKGLGRGSCALLQGSLLSQHSPGKTEEAKINCQDNNLTQIRTVFCNWGGGGLWQKYEISGRIWQVRWPGVMTGTNIHALSSTRSCSLGLPAPDTPPVLTWDVFIPSNESQSVNRECIRVLETSGSHSDLYEDNCLLGCCAV